MTAGASDDVRRKFRRCGTDVTITIGHDVWLGANATVTADVTIAQGCVIGANAVVTRDTDPMGIYGGVPARRIGQREG